VLGGASARCISRISGVETMIELYHHSNTAYRVTILIPWMNRSVRIDGYLP
jgi:hypothetical protein